jgi:carbon storage regulator
MQCAATHRRTPTVGATVPPTCGYRVGPAGRSNVLVLSRRVGESVMIGADVTIVILNVKGRQVRVGIKAPNSIDIYREEILSEARGNTKRAWSTATTSSDL